MKVSIIVPVYNVEKYLRKCLESLIKQTFKDIEIIIVNDGTQDNSQLIIDEYKKKYPQLIRAYKKKNGGLSSARNYGLKYATGKYLLFFDSDDYLDKYTIEKLYKSIEDNSSDIAMCDIIRVYEGSSKEEYQKVFTGNKENKKSFIFSTSSVSNKLIKKDIVVNNKIKFMEGVWFEDVAFFLKIVALSSKISYVPEGLYYYLQRRSSIMYNPNISKNIDLITDFDDAISFFKKKNIFNEYANEIEFYCIDRMYISGITRLLKIKGNKLEKINMIKKYVEYVEKTFPNFKRNKYLYKLSSSRKIIYSLVNLKMFSLIKIILKTKGLLS